MRRPRLVTITANNGTAAPSIGARRRPTIRRLAARPDGRASALVLPTPPRP